ncbi:uncharacterized protein LOC143032622 [Oratosquilla oratoria]|uniref:uncharacterized protein LOC143032622 n=1 Tax=Oratosquilla oratoria TaxID=337810 RepID=UPI003F77093C
MAKLQHEKEIELAKLAPDSRNQPFSQDIFVKRPDLLTYQEGEDIASYLSRFERVANLLQVEEDSLAARLGSTLTGKAAELYSTFDLATISNFSLLKHALLTGFDKTPERYRLDFRNDKIRVGENYRQFATRLRQLFDNWLEACKVPQTFEALRQFVVLDQFLASLIPDIRLFIKEQSVTSLESAVAKADDQASAHKAYPKPNTNYASGKTSFPCRKTNVVVSLPPPSHGSTHQDTKGGAFRTPMRCFNCGEEGHHRSRCPKNPRAFKDKEAQSQFKVGFCMSNRTTPCFTVVGTINGSWSSTIVRDTGCNCVLVSEEAVPDADVSLCPKVSVQTFWDELTSFLLPAAIYAAQNADVSTARYKAYFDVRSQDRKFQPGDEVLILLPSDESKLLVAWKEGPLRIAFAKLLDEPSTIDDSPLHKEICLSEPEDSRLLVTPDGQTDETDSRPNVNPNLEGYQQTSLKELVYPVPVHLEPHFESEVERLFQQGIIQRSSSPHCSPVVMVRKSDGSYRMAIDYRQLNAVTVFHAEPVCNIEEDLYKFSGSKYFSELDLCKAYYQVPLSERAKPLTAFPTHLGLMEFCRLPFGLATACAILVSTLYALRAILDRIRSHHLTLKISKCHFGFPAIQYLGFILGGDCLQPQPDKVEALCRVPPPSTKKLLRSFLGMAADYTGPLSNLLRKTVREPLPWTEELQSLFNHLKLVLSSNPVLRLPDTSLTFVLRTDASNHGLGAVLLQYHLDYPHPVAFASRKLLDRESRYSTIERECLVVVFGIQRFDYYLRGREFVLEVDHKPLTYLHTFKGKNDRLLRWALSLQAYKIRIVHVPGVDNIGADMLSRA